ncbi:MAG: YbbR-like domain-containing protein [Deltaproteobacteria bacterium]|nr:MAG: YbbR-like domain-containing protein [Deltaproteobacteria bacterium]
MKAPDFLGMLRGFTSRNLGLKFMALALSVAAWWFVAGETKVLVGMNVPLEIRELPKGMTVSNKVERQVEVRLSGPSSLLSALKASDISVGVELTNGRPGRQTVTLDDRSVKAPPGIKVQRIFPSTIEIVLERTDRRVIPVSARIAGGAAVRRRVAKVEVDPPSVEIEALPEEFTRMPMVYTEEIVPDRTEGVYSAIARVETREAHAKIVGNPNVRVRIQFRR